MHDLKLLDTSYIEHQLTQILKNECFTLNVLPIIDSTNSYLLQKNTEHIPVGLQAAKLGAEFTRDLNYFDSEKPKEYSLYFEDFPNQNNLKIDVKSDASVRNLKSDRYIHICLAEQQTQGRGRQGKNWVSPFAANLYCSVLWPFKQNFAKLTGLSLMVGAIVAHTLENYGIANIGLKWPNDIYVQPKQKIAGILIESTNERTQPSKIVIGIGVNVFLTKVLTQDGYIDQPWTDVVSNVNFLPDRSELASLLLKNLLTALPLFEKNGFSAFQSMWLAKDIRLNQPITLQINGETIKGIARGVDETGRLVIEDTVGFHYFNSAEIQ